MKVVDTYELPDGDFLKVIKEQFASASPTEMKLAVTNDSTTLHGVLLASGNLAVCGYDKDANTRIGCFSWQGVFCIIGHTKRDKREEWLGIFGPDEDRIAVWAFALTSPLGESLMHGRQSEITKPNPANN